eukprot:m.106396 g.106396  ORF g.106396 m.106396 type:complete len:675 (+) comp27718_c0_seq3:243-2267(+)
MFYFCTIMMSAILWLAVSPVSATVHAVQTWAGTLNMAQGIANNVPMNLSLYLNSPTLLESGHADTSWTYDHDRAGARCVPHTETDLIWTQRPDRTVSISASGVGDNFYSIEGVLDAAGVTLTGNLTTAKGGDFKGTVKLIKDAPQIPSPCHKTPKPTPLPPQPPVPTAGANSSVWPMPTMFTRQGVDTLWIDSLQFSFGVSPDSTSDVLLAAFKRFHSICFQHVGANTPPTDSPVLPSLTFVVRHPSVPLSFGVDESYNLTLAGQGLNGTVEANTVYGALHALESFSQLLHFDFQAMAYKIQGTPLQITDAPRFAWRELMVDTSRHFLPLTLLRRVVDSMTTTKLNVLHLHLVDSQAFPLVLPSAPKLSLGAYSPQERYTMADLASLNAYANVRGIRVVGEIDTPGHGASWCVGMPEVCPSPSCQQPLDVSTNATYAAIEAVLTDLFAVLPDAFVHLGGDEVDTTCWSKTQRIAKWMSDKGVTPDGAYEYFVTRTQAIAHSHGRTTIVWDEIWNHFGTTLNRSSTVINTRFNPSQAPARTMCVANATSHGYRVVRSENIHWYLDQTVHKPWTAQYSFDPCGDLNETSCAFVVGGAASMWGETVDPSDLMQTVWPRAGAVGEKLWSPQSVNNTELALPRYVAFRCYLNRRGFAAAPALNPVARDAPPGPGSCFSQ